MFEGLWGYEHPLSTQFRRLEEELDSLFGTGASLTGTRNIRSLPGGTFPAVNVASTPEAVLVYLFAPGMDAKSFDISIQQNLLSISGSREIPLDEQATYYRQERFSGQFRRTINLPDDADPERVEAKYLNGILTVRVGRRESAKPRQIEVR
ncbi:MAG TPA: Hsp20/alpha crystallin family protein [Steroidobacteraceae bacterium]|nr:Hsp20/alpha crystallin family protein [Steroidobacteraceae bacterium]